MKELTIKASFDENGFMPKRNTGFGEDKSPELRLINLDSAAASIAVVMDDLDIPFAESLNHWVIWNIPPVDVIPENIPYGPIVKSLGNAVQGVGYGKNRYRGPKQPVFVRNVHRYRFRVYALDSTLDLKPSAKKNELIKAMEGHIIQQGEIVGRYKR
jgi:Raf kinase inhibitor-like YbhB/YbcL family protein